MCSWESSRYTRGETGEREEKEEKGACIVVLSGQVKKDVGWRQAGREGRREGGREGGRAMWLVSHRKSSARSERRSRVLWREGE
jgi:5-deoxy-D-glucuronate isomerase